MAIKNDWHPLPELSHNRLLELYRFYLYLGGMPEVNQDYIIDQDIAKARKIQSEILRAYESDFSKYTTKSCVIVFCDPTGNHPRKKCQPGGSLDAHPCAFHQNSC